MCGGGGAASPWLADATLLSAVSSDTLGGSGWTSNQTHYTYFVFRGGHGTCSGIKLNAVVVFHSYTLTSAKSELGSFLSIQAAVIQSAFIPIDLLSFFLLISYYKKDKGIYEWGRSLSSALPGLQSTKGKLKGIPVRLLRIKRYAEWLNGRERGKKQVKQTSVRLVFVNLFSVFTNKHMQKLDSDWYYMGTVIYTTVGYRVGLKGRLQDTMGRERD